MATPEPGKEHILYTNELLRWVASDERVESPAHGAALLCAIAAHVVETEIGFDAARDCICPTRWNERFTFEQALRVKLDHPVITFEEYCRQFFRNDGAGIRRVAQLVFDAIPYYEPRKETPDA